LVASRDLPATLAVLLRFNLLAELAARAGSAAAFANLAQ
jgi:hypothetical protein